MMRWGIYMAKPVTPAKSPGRPPKLDTQIERGKELAKQLKTAYDGGLRELGKKYIKLMAQAITMAEGGDDKMIRFLLEFLPKYLPQEVDESNPMFKLMRGWQGDLHLHQAEPPQAQEAVIPDESNVMEGERIV
jgi:hypothetical protein